MEQLNRWSIFKKEMNIYELHKVSKLKLEIVEPPRSAILLGRTREQMSSESEYICHMIEGPHSMVINWM